MLGISLQVRLLVALVLIACKEKTPPDDPVAKTEAFVKAMCACKDRMCADEVNEQLTKWGIEMTKQSPQVSLADEREIKNRMGVYTECLTKVMLQPAAEMPPKAEAEAPPTK